MAKKQKILVVEDDKKFAESLAKIFTNEGFECVTAEKPQTALSLCKMHTFDIALVDCMLPQMNGVDLAVKIKETVGNGLVLYMMSGIYKDRNFSVSALKKTGAKSFLIKPFDIQEVLKQIKEDADEKKTDVVLSDDPLKNLILQENITMPTVVSALGEKKSISGFEIPHIIAMALGLKVSGRAVIKNANRSLELYFNADGLHVKPHKFVPQMLKDFVSSREYVYLEDLLKVKEEQMNLKTLCEMNIMSPHLAEITEKELMLEEISSLVNLQRYSFDFSPDIPPPGALMVETKTIDDYIHTWISQSINPVWLKNYYTPYLNNLLKKQDVNQNKIQFFPLVASNKNVLALMQEPKNLTEILTEMGSNEETALRVIHLLMLYREFNISNKKVVTNLKSQVERLKNLLKSFDNQDAFEKLGLTQTATDLEIKKAYQEFSSTLHPDKLLDAQEDVKKLSIKVYEKIQNAYDSLKTAEKRLDYLKTLERQKQQKLVDAIKYVDQALLLLLRGDISAADAAITEGLALAPHMPRLKILQAWAGLKNGKMPVQVAAKALQALPTEERDTSIYHYVKGLQNLAANDTAKAIISFKNAIAKDSNFLPARRELSLLPQDRKGGNIFTADLKDVVGLFFNKKK